VHKVNLTKPDKVILVEIYQVRLSVPFSTSTAELAVRYTRESTSLIVDLQTVCGMSIVGDDWEALKRFNVAELSKPVSKVGVIFEADALPERVTTGEGLIAPTTAPDRMDPK
jgi:hypothetical protein